MSSDVPHLRYLLPQFKGNYTALTKTLESSCSFDASDVAKYRLKVLEFGAVHGWKAVRDAFGVERSTYFLWKQEFKRTRGKLSSLVPHSTRPSHVRQMHYDHRLTTFIRSVREQYGRIGKHKLEVLLAAYAQEIGVASLKSTAIGKIAVQTDNGSEFLGVFDQYCQTHDIPHFFTYPRSPRINGGIERFNRTIQEEFIDRTNSLYLGSAEIVTRTCNGIYTGTMMYGHISRLETYLKPVSTNTRVQYVGDQYRRLHFYLGCWIIKL